MNIYILASILTHASAAVCGGYEYVSVSGHLDEQYNGDYCQAEAWNDYPHFENEDQMQLYFMYDQASSIGYW